MKNSRHLKPVTYFFAAFLLAMTLMLSACSDRGLGGGGTPGLTDESYTGTTEESSPEGTVESSSGVAKEPPPESTEEPITSGQPSQTGTLEKVDLEVGRITLKLETGETRDVNVDKFITLVTVYGSAATLEDLQPGDSVEVKVDQATGTASSVTVLSDSNGT